MQIKHERDVANLRWFLRHVSIDILGIHVRDMPEKLHYFAIVMSDGLDGAINSASFRLYNEDLEDIIRSLHHDLSAPLSFSHVYRDTSSQWLQALGLRRSNRDFQLEKRSAEELRSIITSLAMTLGRLVSEIRTKYLEIDLDETSSMFVQNYRKLVEEVEGDRDG